MLKLSWKFGESKWYSYWVIVLKSSSGTNYVPNEHEGVDQYGSFSIPLEVVLYQSHPESLVNQNEILSILQVCLINLKSLLTHRVKELIWKWLCP